MNVEFGCLTCGRAVETAPGTTVRCARCQSESTLKSAPEGDVLAGCLVCDCPEVYRHRDFNQKLGLVFIGVGAALSLWWSTFLPLVGAAILDFLLWYFVPDVAICYRCKAHHRGANSIGAIAVFDLERHEHYRFVKAREEGSIPPRDTP